MGLSKYHTKRKFNQTPEPKGKVEDTSGSLRFVVQKHQASRLHYDFRLEMDGVLKSWAVPKGPSLNPADKRLAMMVEDHPYEYKDFEGNIPEGNYGAGSVMVWDEGTYHALETNDARQSALSLRAGLHKGEIKFFLYGSKLYGGFVLVKLKKNNPDDNAWLLIKEKDEYVDKADVTKNDKSVKTGRNLKEIAEGKSPKNIDLSAAYKSRMPHDVKPMLATLVDEPFDREGWFFEIKWDGFRGVAEVSRGKVELYSRNLLSFNELFAPIVKELKKFNFTAVFDGEVVIVDGDGKSSFQLLQNYQNTGKGNLTYYVFDLLYYNGYDLRQLPLFARKEILKSILPKSKNIKFSDHVEEKGLDMFKLAQVRGIEGIIAKNSQSEYKTGIRSAEWMKIKTHNRQEAVIGGFTDPRGSRKKLGALVLGVYDGDELKYIGHTGGGFDAKTIDVVYNKLKPLEIKESPFNSRFKTNAPVHWVKPQLVCEVSFAEWTSEGQMRQPIFQGLRLDKKAKEVIKESDKDVAKVFSKTKPQKSSRQELKIGGKKVEVTHLDKLYWPKDKITKGDLISYYREMAPIILPYLKDRPENLNRHPNGIEGESFYQKDITQKHPTWVKTKKIYSESNQANINYLVCQDEATLIYMANLGCIEINPWNARIGKITNPDYAIMDLDPEDIGFDKVVETALVVHKILDDLDVPNYCKTSGATGLHIYVPLGAKYDFDQAKDFIHIIGTLVHEKLPTITSLERSPKNRQKRVYLDYLQNRKGQTLAAPYSVRPKPGATVSTPLEWKEVNKKLDPKKFTIKTIAKRLDKVGDLWKPVLGKGINLEKILNKLS